MSTDTVIGVDQSLRSPGFAVLPVSPHENRAVYLGYQRMTTLGGQRLNDIRNDLEFLYCKYRPIFAAQEGFSVSSTNRPFDLGEASGICRELAYSRTHREPLIVAPNQVKKFATGSGAASKEQVMAAIKARWGVDIQQDDMADAYVLAHVARAYLCLDGYTRRCEVEVVASLQKPTAVTVALKGARRKPKANV